MLGQLSSQKCTTDGLGLVGLGGWFRVQGLGFRFPETFGFRVSGFRVSGS